jgi:RNA polymerase sigma factor (sigma-70 family)
MPANESTNESTPVSRGGAQFEQTRWSIVLAAKNSADTTFARDALGKLCMTYWYPLYAFVRREGKNAHDAQDLTQEFFARLLEKNWLGGVDRGRGRFRSWLLASLKHFLANEWDKSRAQKRGSGHALIPLDTGDAESRYSHEPADSATADKLYDRRWALAVLDTVLARLRDEFSAAGKAELFDALKPTLTGEKSPYADIAARLAMTEGAVKVAVHRLRERYRDLIRAEIAETVAAPDEVEDELRHLLAALSA